MTTREKNTNIYNDFTPFDLMLLFYSIINHVRASIIYILCGYSGNMWILPIVVYVEKVEKILMRLITYKLGYYCNSTVSVSEIFLLIFNKKRV